MSLLGRVIGYQDLLAELPNNDVIDATSITVEDELIIAYGEPNKNLITDSDKKVITIDQDSFVNVSNQITWTNTDRAFTATLPQDITTTSDVVFNQVDASNVNADLIDAGNVNADLIDTRIIEFPALTTDGLVIQDDSPEDYMVFEGTGGGGGGIIITTVEYNTDVYLGPPAIQISTTTTTNDTAFVPLDTVKRGVLVEPSFTETDSVNMEIELLTAGNNNIYMGLLSTDFGPTETKNGSGIGVAALRIGYLNSNSDILGNAAVETLPVNTPYNMGAGDKIRIILTGGIISFEFDIAGGGYTAPYSYTLVAGSYRIGIIDNNTQISTYRALISGTVSTGSPPVPSDKYIEVKQRLIIRDIAPDSNTTYNLGSSSKRWDETHSRSVIIGNGSAAEPSLAFKNNPTVGIYSNGVNILVGFDGLGATFQFNANNFRPSVGDITSIGISGSRFLTMWGNTFNAVDGSVGNPSFTFGTTNDGLSRINNFPTMICGGTGITRFTTTGAEPFTDNGFDLGASLKRWKDGNINRIVLDDGTAARPSLTFDSDATTGVYKSGNSIRYTLGGTTRYRMTTADLSPVQTNTYDLGGIGLRWKKIYTEDLSTNDLTATDIIARGLLLDHLSPYDVLYLDANKNVVGLNLPEDNLLVGTTTSPVAEPKGSFYELHQNQLGSKFDPLKNSTGANILQSGVCIEGITSTLRRRTHCINYFDSPNEIGREQSFGFEITDMVVSNNLYMGFCFSSESASVPTPLESGMHCIRASDGGIWINGVPITTIGALGVGDKVYITFQTDSRVEFRSTTGGKYITTVAVVNGRYNPVVFDPTLTLSSYKVCLLPSLDSTTIVSFQVESDIVQSKSIVSSGSVNSFLFQAGDGTAANPSITFTNTPTIGLYRSGNSIRYTLLGTSYYRMTTDALSPETSSITDLGTSSLRWEALYANQVYLGSLQSGIRIAPNGLYITSGSTLAAGLVLDSSVIAFHPFENYTSSTGLNCGLSSKRWKTVYTANLNNLSDARLKENILPCVGLDTVLQLNPVSYDLIGDSSGCRHFGLLAQEVEVIPEVCGVVSHDLDEEEEIDEYGINYIELIPMLIQSVKDLNAKVVALEAEVEVLKSP